jgi:hypothetical protein
VFSKAYGLYSSKTGYTEAISPNWVEEGETESQFRSRTVSKQNIFYIVSALQSFRHVVRVSSGIPFREIPQNRGKRIPLF